MKRTYVNELNKEMDGKKVLLKGWASDVRDLSKIKFLLLRDITGKVQTIALKDDVGEDLFKNIGKIHPESCVEVEGKVVVNKQAKQGFEVSLSKCKILSESEVPLPIDTSPKSQTLIDKRLDYRFLDLRRDKTMAVFKIQSEITSAFREYFKNLNFIEIQTPSIIASASEGGTDLFEVKYFEKKAYLAQSPQLYKQMCAISMEKVFLICPVWRAEKHNTVRHLNESRQMDIEVAFADEFEVMKMMENVVSYIIKQVKKNCADSLEILDINPKIPKVKYLSYNETIELLNKNKLNLKQGDDLSPEAEEKLGKLFPDTIVFVHSWPSSLKPFYILPKEGGISRGFDALYKGMEISSGGQRVHVPEILIKQLKEKGLNPKHFESYINAFRYGSPIHSGWSIGLERLTMLICNLDNIREACLFPRDRDRLTP